MALGEGQGDGEVASGFPELEFPGPVPFVLPNFKERHHHGTHLEGRAAGSPGLAISGRGGGEARGAKQGRKGEQKGAHHGAGSGGQRP